MALIIPEKIIAEVRGTAVPKLANDQNTDDIMPARYLKEITFAKMGEYVYADERFVENVTNPIHPFNNPKYKSANILLAGNNFGCGSSREHAPQGLYRWGIRAIVAEGFAEIFAGNCAAIGIVPVTVHPETLKNLVKVVSEFPTTELRLYLEEKIIDYTERNKTKTICGSSFDIPEGRRQAFLNGTWDAMAVLQANQAKAEQVRQRLPYLE